MIELNGLKVIELLGGITVSYVVYQTIKVCLIRKKYDHIPGPSTKGLIEFFVGHYSGPAKFMSEGKTALDWIQTLHQTFGDVIKFQFMGIMMVSVTNRDAIKEIFLNKDYPKSRQFDHFFVNPLNERFLGVGLLTEPIYERWRHRRNIFNHGFHKNVLMTFVDQFNTKADVLMERLAKFADGKTIINLFTEMNHATLDAIAQIAFGLNIDSINQKDPEFSIAISTTLRTIKENSLDPFYRYRLSNRQKFKTFKQHIRYLRDNGRRIINERLNAMKDGDYVANDILTSILNNWKDQDFDMEAMIDDFVTFFIAGQETTANTLAFCFFVLGKRKDVFMKAREEIDKVLGDRTEITYQDAIELKYCTAIFKESLRLYPPVSSLYRTNTEEMIINGIKIPKDSNIMLSSYLMARNEEFFPKANEFIPERFVKDSAFNNIENYTYFPFSIGPRNCIGQNFAQIEGVIMIAKLIQRFDYTLDPNHDFVILEEITLKPKDGTRVCLSSRK